MAFVTGTAGNDFIHVAGDGLVAPVGYADNPGATDGNDVISQGSGNDYVYAGGGDDEIDLTAGDLTSADTINGGSGYDVLYLLNTGTSALTLDTTAFTNVSHIEGMIVPPRFGSAPTTIYLSNALVGSSDDSHNFTVYLYNQSGNVAQIDASAVTSSANSVTFIDAPYGSTSGSNFTLRGGAGADNFIFYAGADGAPSLPGTSINGGSGIDTLSIRYNGAISSLSATSIEVINLADGGSNSIVVPAGFGSFTSDGFVSTLNGGTGDDTIDASQLLPDNSHTLHFNGGGGADTFKFSLANFGGGDMVNGGADGSIDTLIFTNVGSRTAGDTSGVTHVEVVRLADGSNIFGPADTMVASADDGKLLTIYGGTGNDTIYTQDVTSAGTSLNIQTGAGNDQINILPSQLTGASYTIDGGTGTDTLYLDDTQSSSVPVLFPASTFANVTHIETLYIPARYHATPDVPTIVTLTDALVASSDDNHRLTISFSGESLDSKNSQEVDGSAVTTATNSLLFTVAGNGTFDLIGGAGADVFRFDNDTRLGGPTFNSQITINGGTGASLDTIAISTTGTVAATSFINVSHIEIVTLANFGTNAVTLADAMVSTADDGQLVTVNGGAGNDTIDASQVTTAGNHVALLGGGGTDLFRVAGGNFNSTDTVNGGSDSAIDTLTFVGAAALSSDAFANRSHIEVVRLDDGLNSLVLTDAMVGSADDNHLLTVYGGIGADTIDASAVTTAANSVVFDTGAGNDVLTGGAGNDSAIYTSGFLTFDGGSGSDTIDMSRFGAAIWLGHSDPSGIEVFTKDNSDYNDPGTDRPLANITSVENVVGTAYNDQITGDDADNTYTYTGGYDLFDGRGGINTLDLSRFGSAAWYGTSDPSGIEAWTKDNSDISQSGTWRAIVNTTNVQALIGTPFNDVITLDGKYTYTGGLDTFVAGGSNATLDLSRVTTAIWFGHSDPSGIEAWSVFQSGGGTAWTGLVDVSNVENVIGGAYGDQIYGDAGSNVFTGGGGGDLLVGGGGGDTFVYGSTADSTGATYDTIVGFDASSDRLNLPGTVTGIDTTIASGSLSSASIDSDLAASIGSGQLAVAHAVLFTPGSGDLAGHTFLVVDANGIAGYQAGADYVVDVTGFAGSLATSDFV